MSTKVLKYNSFNMIINILRIEYNILAQPIFRKYKLFQNILRTVLYNLSGFQILSDTQLAVRTWQATIPLHLYDKNITYFTSLLQGLKIICLSYVNLELPFIISSPSTYYMKSFFPKSVT